MNCDIIRNCPCCAADDDVQMRFLNFIENEYLVTEEREIRKLYHRGAILKESRDDHY